MNEPTDLPPSIINHYEDPYHFGQCENATHGSELEDVACGDTIVVELRIDGDAIADAWFDGEGCQISQAAASILMEFIEGKSRSEIEQFSESDMLELIAAEISEEQRECCCLPLKVTQAALQSGDDLDDDTQGATFTGPDLGDEC